MQDLRHYITIIDEARSHADLNVKPLTYDIIQKYAASPTADQLYLHFNSIEKVGVNLQSKNTYGPYGVYAFPLSYFDQITDVDFNRLVKLNAPSFANILRSNSKINVLNISNISTEEFENLFNQVKKIHKKVTNSSNKHYSPLTNNIKSDWSIITKMIFDISRKKNIKMQSTWNSVLRNLGYDALYDRSSILNDNPNQIVFLHSNSFKVLETIPIRIKT